MERYTGYCIDYIEHRSEYRVYDPLHPQQTIAYADSVDEAKQGIDEQCSVKNEVSFDNGYGTIYHFTVVDKFPDSRYCVWNIGDNMIEGYLPLCVVPLRDDGIQEIDKYSPAAIDMSDRPELLQMLRRAAGVGISDLYSAQKHLDNTKSEEPSTTLEKQQYEYAKDLIAVFEKLSEDFYSPEYEQNDELDI